MTADALVFWAFLIAWLLVAAIFILAIVPRLIGEALRFVRRIIAFADDATLAGQLDKAQRDVDRMLGAFERLPMLQERVARAVMTIRTTPVVPPAIAVMIAQVQRELRDFRATFR